MKKIVQPPLSGQTSLTAFGCCGENWETDRSRRRCHAHITLRKPTNMDMGPRHLAAQKRYLLRRLRITQRHGHVHRSGPVARATRPATSHLMCFGLEHGVCREPRGTPPLMFDGHFPEGASASLHQLARTKRAGANSAPWCGRLVCGTMQPRKPRVTSPLHRTLRSRRSPSTTRRAARPVRSAPQQHASLLPADALPLHLVRMALRSGTNRFQGTRSPRQSPRILTRCREQSTSHPASARGLSEHAPHCWSATWRHPSKTPISVASARPRCTATRS